MSFLTSYILVLIIFVLRVMILFDILSHIFFTDLFSSNLMFIVVNSNDTSLWFKCIIISVVNTHTHYKNEIVNKSQICLKLACEFE